MFNASVDSGQLASWQHVKGLITNDDVMVLVQRTARTPLRKLLMPFRHLRLCDDCRVKHHTKKEGYFTHCGMQIGRRKIQSPDNAADTVSPAGKRDTRMQAYTQRLLLARYNNHMLCLNAQRNFQLECVDGAQAFNRSKTNPMRGSPNDRERRTRTLSTIDSSIQIYHPVFSTDNYET